MNQNFDLTKGAFASDLLSHWPEGLIGLDEHFCIQWFNEKAESILGWSADVVIGQDIHNLFCSTAADYMHDRDNCPILNMLSSDQESKNFEAWWINESGVFVNVDVRPLSFKKLPAGLKSILAFQECAGDSISSSSAKKLAMFAELNPAPILEVASDGSIDFANPAMTELMVEHGFDDYGIPLALPNNFEQLVAECVKTKETITNVEVELGENSFIWNFFPVIEKNLVIVQIYGLDVSELRKAREDLRLAKDEAEKANNAKSVFLANMSHEIRTPLNAITGFSNLLLKTDLNETQLTHTKRIAISSSLLMEVLNDILDFSKIEAGKMTLESIDFNLFEQLEFLIDVFIDRIQEKGINLIISFDPSLPVHVKGDPLRLKQILINLVSNAVKFTDVGEVYVGCHLGGFQQDKINLRFFVQDTGKGIAEGKQKQLFDAFTQEDETTTRTHGGTGLGLSICTSLVDLMHGQIGVKSKLGEGSKFYFDIDLDVKHRTSALEFYGLSRFKGRSVCIIESSVAYGNMLKTWFEGIGANTSLFTPLNLASFSFDEVSCDILLFDSDEAVVSKVNHFREHANLTKAKKVILIKKPVDIDTLGLAFKPNMIIDGPVKSLSLVRAILSMEDDFDSAFYSRQTSEQFKLPDLSGCSVLIVDDNSLNRELAMELLKDTKCELFSANDGEEAVTACKQRDFDFVFMDINMPVMDGFEASRIIKRIKPNQLIIAMTANVVTESDERYDAAKIDDSITKPVDIASLNTLLEHWLGKKVKADKTQQVEKEEDVVTDLDALKFPPETFRGIKVKKAMSMIGNRVDLYIKLSKIFVESYSGACDELRRAIDEANLAQAQRLAHTVKGSAANLGADELTSTASTLETALQNNEENLGELISAFDKSLKSSVEDLSIIISKMS